MRQHRSTRRLDRSPLLAFLLTLLLTPWQGLADSDSGAAGHWEGAIQLPGKALQIDVDLKAGQDGRWEGDISIPAQGASDLPLINVSVKDTSVSFTIQGVPGTPTFRGRLSSDARTLTGKFSQAGQVFPFRLERADNGQSPLTEALDGFDAFAEKTLTQWNVPGVAVAVVAKGKLIYAQGFGYRNLEEKLPMTPDTLLPIGSCTKAFTTFVMGTLVDEGKLSWDEPVRTYIPWFELQDPGATTQLTPRDMVTHRSGLPRHDLVWYNDQEPSRKELVERLRYLEPSAQLRERFQYNNLMFMAAGFLVEEITGDTWEHAVRTRILDPLGMKRTTFSDAASTKDDDFAWPYREVDDRIQRIPFREVGNMGPAGSINSSVSEMSHWLTMLLAEGRYEGKQIVSQSTLHEIMTPQMTQAALPVDPEFSPSAYAMGWFVDSFRGHLRLSHAGGIDGFVSQVTLLPNDDIGLVVLSNAMSPLPRLMSLHLMERLLGTQRRDWNGEALSREKKREKVQEEAEQRQERVRVKKTRPSHKLDDYAGVYFHPGYGRLTVARDGKRLLVTYNHIETPFEHWHYDVFNGLPADDPTFKGMKLQFHTNLDGDIVSASLPMEPQVSAIVFQRMPDARLSDPAFLRRLTGRYMLGPQTLTVTLKGKTLFLVLPGQPVYELVPAVGGWFDFKKLNGFRVRFSDPGEGVAENLTIQQPNGVFEATRLE